MAKRKIFGTDGIRGPANRGYLTPNNVLKLAQAAATHFICGDHRHRVVIGKDTRLSGYMLEPALTAGFISLGMDVILVGPLPTPAIAMLVRSLRADLGVMISASHNPYGDNGLKFFDAQGLKLPDSVEKEIEGNFEKAELPYVASEKLGKASRLDDALGRYIEYLKNAFPKNLTLEGLHIVVDCAHGAAYKIAPTVFWELGAKVTTINDKPDGFNINKDCGALHTQALGQKVTELGADIGVALDGDADRVIFVDENGKTIHGDHLLGVIATYWQKTQALSKPAIVGTVMSNMGLELYLSSLGIKLHRAPVGDRYVSSLMSEQAINLGGEPSGHIIMSDYTTTGDGTLSALQLLAYMISEKKKASSLHGLFNLYPETLSNLPCSEKSVFESTRYIKALKEITDKYAGMAYILVRPSGTEPLLRLMVQAESSDIVEKATHEVKTLTMNLLPAAA